MLKRVTFLLLAATAMALVMARTARADETPFAVSVTSDIMVPMRDGTRLATDLYRPARDGAPAPGRFPALLMRTPYDKSLRAPSFAQYFAAHGYVVVVQDVRARYKSQ